MDHLGIKTCVIVCIVAMKKWEEAGTMLSVLYAHNAGGVVAAYLFWTDVLLTYRLNGPPVDPDGKPAPDMRSAVRCHQSVCSHLTHFPGLRILRRVCILGSGELRWRRLCSLCRAPCPTCSERRRSRQSFHQSLPLGMFLRSGDR